MCPVLSLYKELYSSAWGRVQCGDSVCDVSSVGRIACSFLHLCSQVCRRHCSSWRTVCLEWAFLLSMTGNCCGWCMGWDVCRTQSRTHWLGCREKQGFYSSAGSEKLLSFLDTILTAFDKALSASTFLTNSSLKISPNKSLPASLKSPFAYF